MKMRLDKIDQMDLGQSEAHCEHQVNECMMPKMKSRSGMGETSPEDHEEHLKLAEIVKGVHTDLRKKFRDSGEGLEDIWKEHCKNTDVLTQYAEAMHKLATQHWNKNPETRIDWCRDVINDYFRGDGLKKVLEKEERRNRYELERNDSQIKAMEGTASQCAISVPFTEKILLLDVGSCFNPFSEFEEFHSIGIDICPAVESVYKCDFLNLTITEQEPTPVNAPSTFLSKLSNPVKSLPSNSIHVVVFSLLLEYFPAPCQRWTCCLNAHKLLKVNGILIIITPDSHHQHRNAPLIKDWKTAIESIGFKRWRYVKLEHLHCLVFRKNGQKCESEANKEYIEMLKIHQDFHITEKEEASCDGYSFERTSHKQSSGEDLSLTDLLHELPLLGACGDDFT